MQVAGGYLELSAPVLQATVLLRASATWAKDYKRRVQRFDTKIMQFLVDANTKGPEGVVALCAFDQEFNWPSTVICALISLDEGLLLVSPTNNVARYQRVGIFILERPKFFEGRKPCLVKIE